jgi:membrane protein implicated in regulation of membrane protease activity
MNIDGNGRRAFGTLVRDLVDETARLVRGEARLAKLEVARAGGAIGRGALFVAFGSVFLMLGALALLVGLILIVGDQWLPADRYWLAALIAFVITAGVAALFASRGRARLSPSHLAPRQTAATLKENASWVKQQLKSGTTSK